MKNLSLCCFLMMLSFSSFSQTEGDTPEEEATYVGGQEALSKYLYERVTEKVNYKVGGAKVYTEFVVSELGDVTDAKVIRGYNTEFDTIALGAIRSMPKWNPAKDNKGNPMKSKMVVPVLFQ